MHYDVIIVGAGPGGLACATKLAKNKIKTLVVERKQVIGPKSCAGGITWSGLIGLTPEKLIEKTFTQQHVYSKVQRIIVAEDQPIIATVNRENFGQFMAKNAIHNGVEIKTSTSLHSITKDSLQLINTSSNLKETVTFDNLVGADGSSSRVRKFLGLPTERMGVGINYQVKGNYNEMEWHLNSSFFKNGYGWIFPHKEYVSIGAYIPQLDISATYLKSRLCNWAQLQGFNLSQKKCSAGLINYDYRGYHFGNIFLVGDAAGLASALTGEGIFPAILSGDTVADQIIDPHCDKTRMMRLLKKHKRFSRMVQITAKGDFISTILAEVGLLGLRTRVLDFSMLEMGQ